ncbi:MAG: adenylate/guanylate cyclase domain-containing protein, partial [Thermohalobaculum sp.]
DLQNVGPSRCDLYGKLRAESYTDYLIVPLPFSDGTVNTLSIATRRPGGFPAASLNWYRRVVDLLVIVFERYAVLETRSAALETYLGRGVAQEVLKGRIRSGYGEEIEAAILFADLNGFTRLSSNLTPLATVRLLNTYFDCLVGPIEEHGGYVLKFIGDAILAFFPLGPEASASRPVDAVRAIRQRLGELNEARTVAGDEPLSHAVCAHRGRVLYGNVGSSERLDFTVIGEAVNIAARGVDTAKMLGVEYVFTRPFVESFVDSELTYLGSHAMEGVTGSFAFYSFKDDRPDEL